MNREEISNALESAVFCLSCPLKLHILFMGVWAFLFMGVWAFLYTANKPRLGMGNERERNFQSEMKAQN